MIVYIILVDADLSAGALTIIFGSLMRMQPVLWKYVNDFTDLVKYLWNSNYVHYRIWDEITYPFPNFNGAAVDVWELVSNFIPIDKAT